MFIKQYNLPYDLFYFDDIKPIAPRYEHFKNNLLGDALILVLSNIKPHADFSNVEERLETHVFILTKNKLFWFIKQSHSTLDAEVIHKRGSHYISLEAIILHTTLQLYMNFTEELSFQKMQIEYLNDQSDRATSNSLISQVADTEQNLVILEHTLKMVDYAVHQLLADDRFKNKFENERLYHDIQWYNFQINKLVHIYRDLFDAVSSLYSDLINNNLNQLMRYLSSLSLVITTSALIASLWGMNTGGLPFHKHPLGTLIMIGFSIFAGFIMYQFLKRKKFFDD